MKQFKLAAFLLTLFFVPFALCTAPGVAAQTPTTSPCPRVGPCDELPSIVPNQAPAPVVRPTPSAGFDNTKSSMVAALTQVLPSYLRSIEALLVDLFWLYMPLFLGVVIGFSLYNISTDVTAADEPFLKWLIPAMFFLILLPFTADLNGDRRPGDIAGLAHYLGLELAYGHDNTGKVNDSSPVAYPVNQLRDYYNRAYGKFAEGAYTVKLPEGTVTVPRPDGVIPRLRVMYSKGYKLEDIQKNLDPGGWNMQTLFEAMNGARFAFEITDLILMALQAFLDFLIRVMLPLVVVFSIDPSIRKRVWSNYLWFVAISSLVLPVCHQIGRIVCYAIFDFVLYARSTEPYFLFDSTTQSIIQQQDPTTLIFVFVLLSWILVFAFGFGTPALAVAVTKGDLYQWFTGTFSAGFTALASTTLSFVTSSIAGALQQEVAEARARTAYFSGQLGLLSNYFRSTELARSGLYGNTTSADAERRSRMLDLQGQYVNSELGATAEQGNVIGNAAIAFNAEKSRSLLGAMSKLSENQIEWMKTNLGLDTKEASAMLRAVPYFRDVLAKSIDEVPILGNIVGGGGAFRTIDNMRGVLKSWGVTDDVLNSPVMSQLFTSMGGANATNSGMQLLAMMAQSNLLTGENISRITSGGGMDYLRALAKLGTNADGNFDPGVMKNNLYNAMDAMPGGDQLLQSFNLDPAKLRPELQNGNFAGVVRAMPLAQPGQLIKNFNPGGDPLFKKMANQATARSISNPYSIYWHDSQLQSFRSTGDKQLDRELISAARDAGINPNLLHAQFIQESGLKQGAVSYKGARGVAQLMPATAARLGVDIHDRAQNLWGGAQYMRYIADFVRVNGGVTDGNQLRSLTLAGYNAGEGAVQKYGWRIPPYKETQDYVPRILNNYSRLVGESGTRAAQLPRMEFRQPNLAVPNYQYSQTPLPIVTGQAAAANGVQPINAGQPIVLAPSSVNDQTGSYASIMQNTQNLYGQMYQELQTMGSAIGPTASVYLSERLEAQSGRDIANLDRGARNQVAINQAVGESQIAQNTFNQAVDLANWTHHIKQLQNQNALNFGAASTDTLWSAKIDAANEAFQTQLRVRDSDFNYGAMQNQLQFEQSMLEARANTAISIISAVGNTAAHQLEEALEKTNSRL